MDNDLEDAVNEAYSKGIIVVAATGNDGRNRLLYPASYLNCISVGSINKSLDISSFSNYNVFMTMVAPGDDLVFDINGEKITDSGTSFSAPLVSGTLALLKEKFKEELGRKPKYSELYGELIKNCVIVNNIDRMKQGYGYFDFSAKG